MVGSASDLEEGKESLKMGNAKGKVQTWMLPNSLFLLSQS